MSIIVPRSIAGYRQSSKTSEGFAKMKRRGIVLPPFQIEQAVAKSISNEFDVLVAELKKATISSSISTGIGIGDAESELSIETAKRIRKQLAELNASGDLTEDQKRIRLQLSRQLKDTQIDFFRDFFEDASDRMKTRVAFALDKDEVFKDRLDVIRKGYLDAAMERINGGKSDLRKKFIGLLDQWISGEREDIEDFDGLIERISRDGKTFSKFFARDQFSRFNKALMVASYEAAGARWIRWVTVGDQRVRQSHHALNGKIFAIDDLPKEYLDYLCRCAFIGMFEIPKGRQVTRGDGISLMAQRRAA